MPNQVIEFTTDKRFVRRARELKTIAAMVRLYCHGHGHQGRSPLCAECAALFEYATRRLERCVFGDSKPTCTNCLVHCYSADLREQVRVIMKWAGPRMVWRHPILSFLHVLDGRRPAPMLPVKPPQRPEESGPEQPAGEE
jgi:hypothetical protein